MTDVKEIEVVFLIADLSGYTALTEAHGNTSAAKVVARYIEIVHEALHPDAQLIEKVGDEVLIVSVNAAGTIQTAVNIRDTIEVEPLFPSVHTGIHAGKTLKQGNHYFGNALNLTARIAAHARGGQILCTAKVKALTGDLSDVSYRSLGPCRFKNFIDPVEIFEVISGNQRRETIFVDPVCRMQIKQDTAPARLPYKGKTYYFCSFDCVKAFAIHPDRYLAS